MKKFIKIMAFALVLVMLMLPLLSCKKNGGTEDDATSGGGAATVEDDGLPDVTYDNYKFRVLVRKSAVAQADFKVSSNSENLVDQAVYTRNRNVEERFKVEIDPIESSDANSLSEVSIVQAGEDAYDLICVFGRYFGSYSQQGLCVNWYDLPYVNMEADWWHQGIRETFTFANKVFAMTGDISYMSTASAYAVLFSKDIFDENNIAYPYDDVRNGTWTFEKFTQIARACARDLNGDGNIELSGDRMGYATLGWGGPYDAFFATGSRMISTSAVGDPIITYANEKAYDGLTRFFNFGKESGQWIDPSDSNTELEAAVTAGRVAMMDRPLQKIAQYRSVTWNYGIVPFPKMNDSVESYTANTAGSNNLLLVPITSKDLERSSVIIEALCQESSKVVIPVYYDNIISLRTANSAADLEMLGIISQARVYDYGYYDNKLAIGGLLYKLAQAGSTATFYSDYSNVQSATEKALKEMMAVHTAS